MQKKRRGGERGCPGAGAVKGTGRSGTEGEMCLPGVCDKLLDGEEGKTQSSVFHQKRSYPPHRIDFFRRQF